MIGGRNKGEEDLGGKRRDKKKAKSGMKHREACLKTGIREMQCRAVKYFRCIEKNQFTKDIKNQSEITYV